MSGTPFKMTGHTLPGPNQASPMKDKLSRKKKKLEKTREQIKEIVVPPGLSKRGESKLKRKAKKYRKTKEQIKEIEG
jgi:hypothetical protein